MKLQQAINCWEKTLQLKPDYPEVLNNLAWCKAAYPDKSFYDPDDAIAMAMRACELTDYKNSSMLDTLAIAYAASGNFSQAVKTAEQGLSLANSTEQKELIDEIQSHLELFKTGRAYYEKSQTQNHVE